MEADGFLARVRRAVGTASLPDAEEADPGLHVPVLPEVDAVEAFREALGLVGGVLHTGDPREVVVEVAAQHRAATFMSWDEEHLVPGVIEALVAAGLTRLDAVVPAEGRRQHQAAYLDVGLGLTAAEAGFAESGSIVVRSGPGRPRMASVIPPVHVALLRMADIHRSLSHWAQERGDSFGGSANVVFITGVSRTGDIEMRLNTGVHGPAHVHVVLV